MITVAILINGQPLMARSATNTGHQSFDGRVRYRVDDGSTVLHDPDAGAVPLAVKLLQTIQEQQCSENITESSSSGPDRLTITVNFFDDEILREKLSVMSKFEVLIDYVRKICDFDGQVEAMLVPGKTYRITFEEVYRI